MKTTIIVAVLIIILAVVFFTVIPVGMWISAVASGVRISIFSLVGMKLRRVKPVKIVSPLIKATKAGIKVTTNQLEAHYLAGGNVDSVVNALIAAERASMDLSFEQASAIDLAGRDVFEAVTMSVTPKVIETPQIAAVAKDGIELLVKARVTVRTNIDRLICLAIIECTIIAICQLQGLVAVLEADACQITARAKGAIAEAIHRGGNSDSLETGA